MELVHTNRLHVNIQTNFKDASKKYFWCILFLGLSHTEITDTTDFVYNCRYYVVKKNYLCNHI